MPEQKKWVYKAFTVKVPNGTQFYNNLCFCEILLKSHYMRSKGYENFPPPFLVLYILYSAQDFAPWRSDRATRFCVIGPRRFWLLRLFVTPIICLITGPLCGGLVKFKFRSKLCRRLNRGTEWSVTAQQSHPGAMLCTSSCTLPDSFEGKIQTLFSIPPWLYFAFNKCSSEIVLSIICFSCTALAWIDLFLKIDKEKLNDFILAHFWSDKSW